MCVCVCVCEQLVLPESLLNSLKHAFRILNMLIAFLVDIFSPKSLFIQDDYRCPTLDCLKKTVFFLLRVPIDRTN